MTKVGRIFEEEKIAYGEQCWLEGYFAEAKRTATLMLEDGCDIVEIMRYSELSRHEIEDLQKSLST